MRSHGGRVWAEGRVDQGATFYIARQVDLLSQTTARGLFQLTFYDLDLTGVTLPPGSILPLFTHLGLADSAMHAKTALSTWDAVFERPYGP